MKLTLEQITEGEEEVLIRYRGMTPRIEAMIGLVKGTMQKIPAVWEGQTIYLSPEQIFYLENIDGVTYAYLEEKVARISSSLKALELQYAGRGFFRCSKAMVLNINKISYLRSEAGGRIRATMENGEQVIISRKYGKELRRILRGGGEDAEEI